MKYGSKLGYTYLELTIAMVSLGVNVVAGKAAVASLPLFIILALRFFIGTITFLPAYYIQERKTKTLTSNKDTLVPRDWLILFLQALFGAFLFNLFMLYGLHLSTATSAGILTSTTPAFTALLSFLFLAEKIRANKLIAITASILGIIIININLNDLATLQWDFIGNLFILLAIIAGAFLTIFIKMLSNKISPLFMSLTFNLFGFLLFLPLAIYDALHVKLFDYSFLSYSSILIYGVSGSIIFPILWARGISKVSASTASLFSGIMPISTALLAYLFLGEKISIVQFMGICFVLASITLDVFLSKGS